jgi:hypothetical protein
LFRLLSINNLVVIERKLELFTALDSNTQIIIPPGVLRDCTSNLNRPHAKTAATFMEGGSVTLPSSLIETVRAGSSANRSLP